MNAKLYHKKNFVHNAFNNILVRIYFIQKYVLYIMQTDQHNSHHHIHTGTAYSRQNTHLCMLFCWLTQCRHHDVYVFLCIYAKYDFSMWIKNLKRVAYVRRKKEMLHTFYKECILVRVGALQSTYRTTTMLYTCTYSSHNRVNHKKDCTIRIKNHENDKMSTLCLIQNLCKNYTIPTYPLIKKTQQLPVCRPTF